jgi:hypothetical protein
MVEPEPEKQSSCLGREPLAPAIAPKYVANIGPFVGKTLDSDPRSADQLVSGALDDR